MSSEANTREPASPALFETEAPSKKQGRQERSTQHHAESGNSPAGRRKDPGVRA
jgi:hypothetical protein